MFPGKGGSSGGSLDPTRSPPEYALGTVTRAQLAGGGGVRQWVPGVDPMGSSPTHKLPAAPGGPPARPASARTQATCAHDCPSQKPALPVLSLTWKSPITQPALRQSCSGSRGPGKRTYLHWGPFLGCERTDVGAARWCPQGLAGSGSAWARQAPGTHLCGLCPDRAASGSWQVPGSRAGTNHGVPHELWSCHRN